VSKKSSIGEQLKWRDNPSPETSLRQSNIEHFGEEIKGETVTGKKSKSDGKA
jgi:hypothetical protein